MDHLHWGIVGPGKIAAAFTADLSRVKRCKNTVVGVMSDKHAEAVAFAKKRGIAQSFDNLSEMLRESHPDIVYIASPHANHFASAMLCIQRGCAVLCEKPLTLNTRQATLLIEAARMHHVFLMEGMWIRFLPSIVNVLHLLNENTIGDVTSIIANMSYVAPKNKNNRFYNPELGGGSLLDLGIYPVYLSLLVLGIPRQIAAVADLSDRYIDESCITLFHYNKKRFALLESSIVKNLRCTATIYGTEGKIKLLKQWNEKPEAIEVSLFNGRDFQIPCKWKGRGFQYEIEEVIRCLETGKIESSLHSHDDSLSLIKTLDKIRKKTRIFYPVDKKEDFIY